MPPGSGLARLLADIGEFRLWPSGWNVAPTSTPAATLRAWVESTTSAE